MPLAFPVFVGVGGTSGLKAFASLLDDLDAERSHEWLTSGRLDNAKVSGLIGEAMRIRRLLIDLDLTLLVRLAGLQAVTEWRKRSKRSAGDYRVITQEDFEAEWPYDDANPAIIRPTAVTTTGWVRAVEARIGPRPRIFIASSKEQLPAAKILGRLLEMDGFADTWPQSPSFRPGAILPIAVQDLALDYEFGVFMVQADDVRQVRGRSEPVPRDNVLWECAAFTGSATTQAAMIVIRTSSDSGRNPVLPTDLHGVLFVPYGTDAGNEELTTVAERLRLGFQHALEI